MKRFWPFKKEQAIPENEKEKTIAQIPVQSRDLVSRIQRKRIFWSVFSAHAALGLACILSGWMTPEEKPQTFLIQARILPVNMPSAPQQQAEQQPQQNPQTLPRPPQRTKPKPKPVKPKPTTRPKPKPAKPKPQQRSTRTARSAQNQPTAHNPPRSPVPAVATALENQTWEGDRLKPYVMTRFSPLAPSRFDLNGETPQCTVQITINAEGAITRMAFTEPCPSPALESAVKTLFAQMKTVPKKEKGPFPYTTTITFQVE